MSRWSKVLWSEGMFLRPQHFQQQERYFEVTARQRVAALHGFGWGFSELEIDEDALPIGSLRLRRARGLLPDGTPFVIPDDIGEELAVDVARSSADSIYCLALPPDQAVEGGVLYVDDAVSAARYLAKSVEVTDVNAAGAGMAEMQCCRMRLHFMPEEDVPAGWVRLRVAKVVERQANNLVVLDRTFVPPWLDCRSNGVLDGYAREIANLLFQRGGALAERVSAGGRGGLSEVADFLLLMLVNRHLPEMRHLAQMQGLHPTQLFQAFLGLAGELATFSNPNRQPSIYPSYQHDDIQKAFLPVVMELRRALSMVLEQSAIRIALEERKYGIKVALVPEQRLFSNASFVLAVFANLPPDQLQALFVTQAKVGPVEKIRDLVNLHLSGVRLKPLPVVPRELPYHAGYCYFELDSHHELWREMERSAGMALHVSGDFPGLELECWAIRK
jgi:type VI secretion system protein ImpJ